ncbi:MAG: ribonuclease H-like domain-containing protein [Bryobacteraceae bacterium]|nr:ribonuclease H-like domain-containing protein [Bryobacteraceae bacterium]
MLDIQEQLATLRQRIARIDRKFASPRPPQKIDSRPEVGYDFRPAKYFVEEYLSGAQVQTPFGSHFETERLWESHRRHGNLDISTLAGLPHDLLDAISAGSIPRSDPTKWAFLDTETTGLAGGAGCYAFLVGVGRITSQGFHLRQFFMREPSEEASLLHRLTEYLAEFDVLVTYNGRTYDQPLLETRFQMARSRTPFARLQHLDLLHGARRLWKLRFESCRLVELETQVLGVEREGDLPGEMIPYVYFDYLRTREIQRVVPILHHNALDILTLGCLTAVVPWAFRDPLTAPLTHGAEMIGLGRWLAAADQNEKALILYRRGIGKRIPDELLFRTLWEMARLEKKLGNTKAALSILEDLSTSRNPRRCHALEELAKHYEHRERNYRAALEHTLAALEYAPSDGLRKRRDRLQQRQARHAGAGSLL